MRNHDHGGDGGGEDAARPRLIERALAGFGRLERRLLTSPRLRSLGSIRLAIRCFHRNADWDRAAALTFWTVLSIIPLAVIFFSVVNSVGGGEKIAEYVKEQVLATAAPDLQQDIRQWLDEFIEARALEKGTSGLVNVFAFFGLVGAAGVLYTAAERNFNRIWSTARARSFIKRFLVFWLILTLSPFLLALSMWVGEVLVPEGGLIDRLADSHPWIGGIYEFVVPLSIGVVAFALLNGLLPNTRVRFKSALLGGLVAGLLWELTKRGFYLYVAASKGRAGFYPQLAAVPLALIWLWLTWATALFGAEVACCRQNFRALLMSYDLAERPRRSRIGLGLSLLGVLRDAFMGEAPLLPLEKWARRLDVESASLEAVARRLEGSGYLLEAAEQPGAYVLARAPERVALRDVALELLLDEFPHDPALQELAGAKGGAPSEGSLATAWSAFLTTLEGQTLAGWDGAEAFGP